MDSYLGSYLNNHDEINGKSKEECPVIRGGAL